MNVCQTGPLGMRKRDIPRAAALHVERKDGRSQSSARPMCEGVVRTGRKYGRRRAYAEKYGVDCSACATLWLSYGGVYVMHAIHESVQLPVFTKCQQRLRGERTRTHGVKTAYMLSESVIRVYEAQNEPVKALTSQTSHQH